MKITLLRHGNRDLTMSSDGGLNRAGNDLAAGLPSKIEPNGNLPKPTQLISSPKKRAQETLLPMSKALELPLLTEEDLDERRTNESSVEFRSRVKNYLELLPNKYKSSDVVCLCTHSDWLDDAMIVLPSDIPQPIAESGFACGEYRSFEFKDGLWVYLR